jgi:6-phosphogluconolactonase (cycloisomerase 2 family)
MTAAEIILLPPLASFDTSSSLLICSNRFSTHSKGDALALFKVDDKGKVESIGHFYPGGKHLRGLVGDRVGKRVVVVCRDGGGVVVFERVGDGLELKEVARCEVEMGVVPLWMD